MSPSRSGTEERMQDLEKLLYGADRLLVIMHDNPDPDAIASAWALSHLVREQFKVNAVMAYGGTIGRAENRTMVKSLHIHVKQIRRLRIKSYNRIALVDTQPLTGNNSLGDIPCNMVIDHHPVKRNVRSDMFVIEPDVGATATIMVEWLLYYNIEIPTDLATALTYAIRTETQELGRETSSRDISAYLWVYSRANKRKLAHIIHPKLPKSYFITFATSLNRTIIYRNLICAHLGDVKYPDVVAEMADFLLRCRHISLSLCTGWYRKDMILSLRSTNPRAQANLVIKKIIASQGPSGGHETYAGGRIHFPDMKDVDKASAEIRITSDFAGTMGYENAAWKPLLETE